MKPARWGKPRRCLLAGGVPRRPLASSRSPLCHPLTKPVAPDKAESQQMHHPDCDIGGSDSAGLLRLIVFDFANCIHKRQPQACSQPASKIRYQFRMITRRHATYPLRCGVRLPTLLNHFCHGFNQLITETPGMFVVGNRPPQPASPQRIKHGPLERLSHRDYAEIHIQQMFSLPHHSKLLFAYGA